MSTVNLTLRMNNWNTITTQPHWYADYDNELHQWKEIKPHPRWCEEYEEEFLQPYWNDYKRNITMLTIEEVVHITEYLIKKEDLQNWLVVMPHVKEISKIKRQLEKAMTLITFECKKCQQRFASMGSAVFHYEMCHKMTAEEIFNYVKI